MTFSTDMALRLGPTVHAMKDTIKKEKNMEEALTCGQMAPNTLVTGLITKSTGKVSTLGLTVVLMKVPGKIIICTDKAHIHGVMGENMKASTTWIRNMATAYISGQTGVATRDTGRMANNTEKASIFCLTGSPKLAYGKMERGLSGSTKLILMDQLLLKITSTITSHEYMSTSYI